MQYSFDQLKMAIEYLARQQGDHQALINELLGREPGSNTVRVIERTETIIKDGDAQPVTANSNRTANVGAGAKASPAGAKASPAAAGSMKQMAKTDGMPSNKDLRTQAATTGNLRSVADDGNARPNSNSPSEKARMSEVGLTTGGDFNNPLQKQATQTQRLLGNLEENFEKAQDDVRDHENRIIKLESKAEACNNTHKKGKYQSTKFTYCQALKLTILFSLFIYSPRRH